MFKGGKSTAFNLLNGFKSGNLTGIPRVAPQGEKWGFTIIELLVVVVIIGILASLSVVSLNSIRMKARDIKRIGDVRAIYTALDLYNNDEGSYPATLNPGEALVGPTSRITYLAVVPKNAPPRMDNGCADRDYSYFFDDEKNSYSLIYCLGDKVGSAKAGDNKVQPGDMTGDAYTKLSLRFNGSVKDYSGYNSNVSNPPVFDSANAKLGSQSGLFPVLNCGSGSGSDRLPANCTQLPNDPNWNFGAGDWTIDAWFKLSSTNNNPGLGTIIARSNGVDPVNTSFSVYFPPKSSYINCMVAYNGNYSFNAVSSVATNDTNWHHVACVRSGGSVFLYLDGQKVDTKTGIGVKTLNNPDQPLVIGFFGLDSGDVPNAYTFKGYLDGLRVSKGIARWTGDTFVPPSIEE